MNADAHSAVIMARPLWWFTRFMWWKQWQVAVNHQTKPTDNLRADTVNNRHHLLLVLLSPKADTHLTIPKEGRIKVAGYILGWFTCLKMVNHPSTTMADVVESLRQW